MKLLKLMIGDFTKENMIGTIAVTILVLGRFFAPAREKVYTEIFGLLLFMLSLWFASKNPDKKEGIENALWGLFFFAGVLIVTLLFVIGKG